MIIYDNIYIYMARCQNPVLMVFGLLQINIFHVFNRSRVLHFSLWQIAWQRCFWYLLGHCLLQKWFSNIVNSRWQISVADHFSKKRDQIGVESIRIVGGRPRGRPHSPKCDRIMSSKHTYSGWQITWQTTFIKFEPWRGVIFTKLQDTRGRPRGRPPADEKMQFPGLEPIWPLWAPWQTSWQSKCYDFITF